MEAVSDAKFYSVGQAIHWALAHNPARAKHPNILELEHGSKPPADDFTREHPDWVHSSVINAIRGVLRDFPLQQRIVFNLVELGRPYGCRFNPLEVAEHYGISDKTVYRWLSQVRDEIRRELVARGLMDDEEI